MIAEMIQQLQKHGINNRKFKKSKEDFHFYDDSETDVEYKTFVTAFISVLQLSFMIFISIFQYIGFYIYCCIVRVTMYLTWILSGFFFFFCQGKKIICNLILRF